MGKFETTIKISKDENGVWAQEIITMADKATGGAGTKTEGEKVKVGDKNVKVELKVGKASSYADLSEVTFVFDRGSGAVSEVIFSVGDEKKGYDIDQIYFKISKASKIKYVEIVPLTGKVTTTETDA